MSKISRVSQGEQSELTKTEWSLVDQVSDGQFIEWFYLGADDDSWEYATTYVLAKLAPLLRRRPELLDRLIRASALLVPRWEELHSSGATFGQHLMSSAIRDSAGDLSDPIVEGLLREGQLAVLCGDYHVGKTPLVQDLAFHLQNGISWLGREVHKREVIMLDFETPLPEYLADTRRLRGRYSGLWQYPNAYLLLGDAGERVHRLPEMGFKWHERLRFLRRLLKREPEALIIVDPAEHFFRFDRDQSTQVHSLYFNLRKLLTEFPGSAIVLVVNRRRGRLGRENHSLLKDPRRWLNAACPGSLDILNRCDVRLGFDFHDDPVVRVLNGVRRKEPMSPIVLRPVESGEHLAGFERVQVERESLVMRLTKRQRRYFQILPDAFRFEDIVMGGIVPRASLSRLLQATRALGLTESSDRLHRKI